jgi:hypothetical protein
MKGEEEIRQILIKGLEIPELKDEEVYLVETELGEKKIRHKDELKKILEKEKEKK